MFTTLEKEAALSLTLLASSSIESTAAKRNKTTTNKTKTKRSQKKTIAKPKKKKLWKIIATTDNDLRCRVERWPSGRLKCAIPEHLPPGFILHCSPPDPEGYIPPPFHQCKPTPPPASKKVKFSPVATTASQSSHNPSKPTSTRKSSPSMPSDSHKARRSSRLASKVVTPLKDTPDHLEDDNSTEYDSLSQQKISSIFPPKVNAKSPSKVKAKAPSDCPKRNYKSTHYYKSTQTNITSGFQKQSQSYSIAHRTRKKTRAKAFETMQ